MAVKTKKRAVLMCAGEYEPVPILRNPDHADKNPCDAWIFVAVDGGLGRFLKQGIEPDLILGDFDSLGEEYRDYLEAVEASQPEKLLRLPCEKDDTDTMYALRVCLEKGCSEFLLYGALGGRLDHTIANIQALAWLKKHGADGYLCGRNTIVTVLQSETVFLPEEYEGTFSLFALDSRVTGVTLRGMKYPLQEAVLENTFPIGVSNEIRRKTQDDVPADIREADICGKPCCGKEKRASVTVREGMALMILERPETVFPVYPQKRDRVTGTGSISGGIFGKRCEEMEGEMPAAMPDPSEMTRNHYDLL